MPGIFDDERRETGPIWPNPYRTRPICLLDVVAKGLKWQTLPRLFTPNQQDKWVTPAPQPFLSPHPSARPRPRATDPLHNSIRTTERKEHFIMADTFKILGIAGSLREASFNRALLEAAKGLAPEGMTIEITDISGIPLYNEDVRTSGFPDAVTEFGRQIAGSRWRP